MECGEITTLRGSHVIAVSRRQEHRLRWSLR